MSLKTVMRFGAALILFAWIPLASAEPLRIFAAGSLKAAFTQIGEAFDASQSNGTKTVFEFGASGLLRERIETGEAASVFASADTGHPKSLENQGKTKGSVAVFARNSLCALAAPRFAASSPLIEVLLDANNVLGISTPKSDPSGDYALAVFDKADALRPGAGAALRAKARQLTGGPATPKAPSGQNQYAWLVGSGQADVFLTYCTNAVLARAENPVLQSIPLPPDLAVGADYGLVLMAGAPALAKSFADFIQATPGRAILIAHGFEVPK